MMIGALKPPLRSERTTSRPSVSGRPTSISTRSGELAFAALAPFAPVPTAEASHSACSDNCSTSASRRPVSSSTMRRLRAVRMLTSYELRHRQHAPVVASWQGLVFSWRVSRSVLVQVGNYSRFTSRRLLYSKSRGHFDERRVMNFQTLTNCPRPRYTQERYAFSTTY